MDPAEQLNAELGPNPSYRRLLFFRFSLQRSIRSDHQLLLDKLKILGGMKATPKEKRIHWAGYLKLHVKHVGDLVRLRTVETALDDVEEEDAVLHEDEPRLSPGVLPKYDDLLALEKEFLTFYPMIISSLWEKAYTAKRQEAYWKALSDLTDSYSRKIDRRINELKARRYSLQHQALIHEIKEHKDAWLGEDIKDVELMYRLKFQFPLE